MSTIWRLLEQRAGSGPDALFAIDERDDSLTVAEALDRAVLAAGALARDRGVGPGDVVAWQLPNWLDSIVLCLTLSRLQAVQLPIVPIFRDREVGFMTAQAGARLLVVADGATAPRTADVLVLARGELPAVAVELSPFVAEPVDTLRWFFYTSGTTADPKGARHTDATLVAAAHGVVDALGVTPDDRMATLLPLAHIGGVIRIVTCLLSGAAMLVSPVFDPQRSIPFLRRHGATLVPGAMPFVHAAFDVQAANPDLAPLFPAARAMIHGGAPKPPGLHHEAKRRLGTAGIVSGYGLTECPMAVWNRPTDTDDDLATTEGLPAVGVELRIVDADGKVQPAGEEGEVRLRGGQLMLGYVDSTLDAAAFDGAGFLRTGDLGVLDEHGRLTITGRLKDVIIRNMENISATELEHFLHEHPKVREVAVIGVPDELTGERACAVVVAADRGDPPTLEELGEHLLVAGLSKRKLPERLELVATLPRNAMDKVQKNELRDRYRPAATTTECESRSSEVKTRVGTAAAPAASPAADEKGADDD